VLRPITSISGQWAHLQQASGSLDRVDEVLNAVTDVVQDPLAKDLPPVQGHVQLDHVSFRYDDGPPILRDLSLTIPAGAKVAIVGPSGAGKSTIVGLLLRAFDPSHGRVLFDGQDIREATLASVRGQTGLVPQDTFLFNLSVAENIALGREGATQEDIMRAAEAAALAPVIERLEQGYMTVVGEWGARLSGGQRQRLNIARALIRDPRLLLLDEATSALDPHTESAIMQTIGEVARGRTTVMVTHRLSSAVDCDIIFVLDQGRLVEQGTHQELLQRQGLYWRMYSEQQAGVLDALGLPVDPRRLTRVPIFASLGPADLALVGLRVTIERHPAGTVIVRQGEVANKLYVIASGEVEVLVEDQRGAQRRVTALGPWAYFGEIALLGDESVRRTATVRAVGDVELYSLHRDDFISILRSHPEVGATLSSITQTRIAETYRVVSQPATTDGAGVPAAEAPTLLRRVLARASLHNAPTVPLAILTIREGPDAGQEYLIDERPAVIGRSTDNAVPVNDDEASRRHCRVYWDLDAYAIEDLRSSNGTYLNGSPVESARLRSGDLIQVGATVIEFTLRP
jgi:ATP-binding cassette subfamily B protein